MVVTVHYKDDVSWLLQKHSTGATHFAAKHDAINIAAEVVSVLDCIGMPADYCPSITTD